MKRRAGFRQSHIHFWLILVLFLAAFIVGGLFIYKQYSNNKNEAVITNLNKKNEITKKIPAIRQIIYLPPGYSFTREGYTDTTPSTYVVELNSKSHFIQINIGESSTVFCTPEDRLTLNGMNVCYRTSAEWVEFGIFTWSNYYNYQLTTDDMAISNKEIEKIIASLNNI